MWQVVLAAVAAAGSSILAKRLIHPNESAKENHISESSEICQNPEEVGVESLSHEQASGDGEIFRFSSAEKENKGVKKKKKKGWSGLKEVKGNGVKKNGGEKDKRGGKRVTVCLKKRRTSKTAPGKCESCASKDNTFGWGVGLGIAYMMSAGKLEISRLKSTVEETGKVVQELQAEISRKKNVCSTDTYVIEKSHGGPSFTKPGTESQYMVAAFGLSIDEDECGSSGVIEGQHPEVMEMDRLEAELESELQKLPWCDTEELGSGRRPNICEEEDYLHQFEKGVLASELDKKLCHVLIEQQESQIAELEAELDQANSKLHEKEAELQALKNCVKRLSEFSLATDDENESMDDDGKGRVATKSTVGMKRAMEYDPPDCS